MQLANISSQLILCEKLNTSNRAFMQYSALVRKSLQHTNKFELVHASW